MIRYSLASTGLIICRCGAIAWNYQDVLPDSRFCRLLIEGHRLLEDSGQLSAECERQQFLTWFGESWAQDAYFAGCRDHQIYAQRLGNWQRRL